MRSGWPNRWGHCSCRRSFIAHSGLGGMTPSGSSSSSGVALVGAVTGKVVACGLRDEVELAVLPRLEQLVLVGAVGPGVPVLTGPVCVAHSGSSRRPRISAPWSFPLLHPSCHGPRRDRPTRRPARGRTWRAGRWRWRIGPWPMERIPIRPVRPDELGAIRDIEVGAGVLFADIGMSFIADEEPPPVELLEQYRRAGPRLGVDRSRPTDRSPS